VKSTGWFVLRLLAAALAAWVVSLAWIAEAQEASVPASVQAELVAKLASYDKNFATRSGDRVRIMIVTMRGDADSTHMGGQLRAAFAEMDRVGGLPHEELMAEYSDPPTLASTCRNQHVAIVYLTAGMFHEVEAIGKALEGVSILSVGAVGGYSSKGAVIDFFTEGGKPKIALNLAQARRQQVALAPEVVRIMRVIE
jgi:hypothetical protein